MTTQPNTTLLLLARAAGMPDTTLTHAVLQWTADGRMVVVARASRDHKGRIDVVALGADGEAVYVDRIGGRQLLTAQASSVANIVATARQLLNAIR